MKKTSLLGATLISLVFGFASTSVSAQDALRVYGPGGPAPAMNKAAVAFSETTGIKVEVTAGPTPKWKQQAIADADLIYSGSEHMMSDFAKTFDGLFDINEVTPLYLRSSAILVRPGNPKNITGFKDLLNKDLRILVVAGAGQTGLWEDIAGRAGNIEDVRALRKNLVLPEAANSGVAKQMWENDASLDAWLIWGIWQVANPALADAVEMEPEYRIWRDAGAVVTTKGKAKPHAQAFIDFLLSDEGKAIFAEQGWKTQ